MILETEKKLTSLSQKTIIHYYNAEYLFIFLIFRVYYYLSSYRIYLTKRISENRQNLTKGLFPYFTIKHIFYPKADNVKETKQPSYNPDLVSCDYFLIVKPSRSISFC